MLAAARALRGASTRPRGICLSYAYEPRLELAPRKVFAAATLKSRAPQGLLRSKGIHTTASCWLPVAKARQAVGTAAGAAAGAAGAGARVVAGTGINAVAGVLRSSQLLRWGLGLGAGVVSLSVVLQASVKMQHKITTILRSALEYAIYFAIAMLGMLSWGFASLRRRLSMRSVHNQAYKLVRDLPLLKSKLGTPITISEKRIEIRTGDKWKWVYHASRAVNAAETVTGIDLDADGDVGEESEKQKHSRQAVGGVRGLFVRAGFPISYKYKPQRAHMVFPIVGVHDQKAMVSVEAVKRNKSSWLAPLGYNDFKLVAVDFADNTYTIVQGDEERYDRELIKRLRVPMITWMQAESSIEEQEEVGEEIYRRR